MRVLLIHTHYQQPGGEDAVFAAETALLQAHGHTVHTLTFHNRDLEQLPRWQQALFAIWNPLAYRRVRQAVETYRPEIVHIHNTFPLASPAVIQAAQAAGSHVVMTLHNYRLGCLNALLYRQGQVCEACLGRSPWPGVRYACYRGRGESAVVAAMLMVHRALHTWSKVDRFIVLTPFAHRKFVTMGLPEAKLRLKPNFVAPDPGPGRGQGGYVLFVGRLAPEKGILTLLNAWQTLTLPWRLVIVGDGPLRDAVQQAVSASSNLTWLGWRTHAEVIRLMQDAEGLILPSECYEMFPLVLTEALACACPVVVADGGAPASLVRAGETGLLFRRGDAEDLAAKVRWLYEHPAQRASMRRAARADFEAHYTAERNYQRLMEIYTEVLTP